MDHGWSSFCAVGCMSVENSNDCLSSGDDCCRDGLGQADAFVECQRLAAYDHHLRYVAAEAS